MAKVRSAEELAEALKKEEDTIEIEGDLSKKVVRIRATGKIAWVIAIAAIAIAVYSILTMPATGGTSIASGLVANSAAVGILGFSVTTAAISIAVAGGGIGILTTLRGYKEVSRTENTLVLKKK